MSATECGRKAAFFWPFRCRPEFNSHLGREENWMTRVLRPRKAPLVLVEINM